MYIKLAVALLFFVSVTITSGAVFSEEDICPRSGEVYWGCGGCEGSCEDPYPMCTMQCRDGGCFCAAGLVRDSTNSCISPDACPTTRKDCGRHEERRLCGSSCPPTCRNYKNIAATNCIALCVNECFCKDGFVRDERSKRCVRPYQCPRL